MTGGGPGAGASDEAGLYILCLPGVSKMSPENLNRRTRNVLLVPVLMLASGTAYSADGEADDEECIFDQAEQQKAYLALEKKYPGSRFVEEKYHLLIPAGGAQVILRRGGCVHFGIAIEFRTRRTDDYDDEAAFFAKVSELMALYGQNLLKPEVLERSRAKQAPQAEEMADGVYYFLPYPDAVFEAFRRQDDEYTTIGVSFYY
jgi:hypothetical protein